MSESEKEPVALFEAKLGLRPERPFEPAELARIAYRPTLIIGLGGTGQKVLRKLKKRVRKFFEEERQAIFQFLVFDTDAEERAVGEWLDPGEFRYLGNIDGNGIVDSLDVHEFIRPWWPKSYYPGFINQGAKAVRCVGRLALFHRVNEIVQNLTTAITQAIHVDQNIGTQTTTAKVYIVTSLCGGTGSGMLLDMAYIARELLMQRNRETYVTGVLVMPDAFEPMYQAMASVERARANTYAALKELDHLMASCDFAVRYSQTFGITQASRRKPLDVAYLVGATNEMAQHLGDINSLAEMIAEEIFLEIASPMGEANMSQFDNIDNLNNTSDLGKIMAYSSFAVAALTYPMERIVTWCAVTDTARLIEEVLLYPTTDSKASIREAEVFMSEQQIWEEGADQVITQLAKDARGQPILVEVNLAELEGYYAATLLDLIRGIEVDRGQQLANATDAMDDRLTELRQRVEKALETRVQECLVRGDRGITFTNQFVDSLLIKVNSQRDEQMIPEAQYWSEQKDLLEKRWQDAKGEVAIALESLPIPFIKERRIRRAVANYVEAYNGYLQAYVELEKRGRAITFYETLAKRIMVFQNQLKNVIDKLRNSQQQAKMASERALVTRSVLKENYVLARSVIDLTGLKQLYERFSPRLETAEERRSVLTAFLAYVRGKDEDWSPLAGALEKEDLVGIRLCTFLEDWFHSRLADLDVLGLIQEMRGRAQVSKEVNTLFEQAGPFWSYTTVGCPEGESNLQPISLVGLYRIDREGSQWVDVIRDAVRKPFSAVPTNDRYQLVVLTTKHGLPLYTLNALGGPSREAYEHHEDQWQRHLQGTRPLHASEEWEREARDIHPRPAGYAQILFAVGIGLGLIYSKGEWYYVRAWQEEKKPHKQDYQLAMGRHQALSAFINRREAREDLERHLREQMASRRAETLDLLKGYLPKLEQEIEQRTDLQELLSQEKAWVEEFIEEHRRIIT